MCNNQLRVWLCSQVCSSAGEQGLIKQRVNEAEQSDLRWSSAAAAAAASVLCQGVKWTAVTDLLVWLIWCRLVYVTPRVQLWSPSICVEETDYRTQTHSPAAALASSALMTVWLDYPGFRQWPQLQLTQTLTCEKVKLGSMRGQRGRELCSEPGLQR